MNVLEIKDLSRGYGGQPVLADIGFSVAPGEVVGLLGRNGAGKTTLINLVMGLLAPDRGTVRVFGQDPRLKPVAVRQRRLRGLADQPGGGPGAWGDGAD